MQAVQSIFTKDRMKLAANRKRQEHPFRHVPGHFPYYRLVRLYYPAQVAFMLHRYRPGYMQDQLAVSVLLKFPYDLRQGQ